MGRPSPEALRDLKDLVDEHLAGYSVETTGDLAAAATGTDFVRESGPERPDIKEQMFATLCWRACPVRASGATFRPTSR
ncbi:hypothetical protein [Streptomyces sp. NPDC055134]